MEEGDVTKEDEDDEESIRFVSLESKFVMAEMAGGHVRVAS